MSTSDHGEGGSEAGDAKQTIPFLSKLIATGFYSGYAPWASGTLGTLVGALFFLIPYFSSIPVLAAAIVVATIAGVITSGHVAAAEGHRVSEMTKRLKTQLGQNEHGNPDPSIVVIDEIVGMWISMFAISPSLFSVGVAFVAFRIFDIIKPYPARQMEHLRLGWGIMLDDVVAGIYANIAARLVIALANQFFPGLT
ncbi:MAG: phosphatidylglycerophosphatase A [Ignavibacteriae bacterium]|nr:phosphatidylglycerophosphatase A [Ignavibacteriota bacterium]